MDQLFARTSIYRFSGCDISGFFFCKVTEPGREESQPLSVRGVGSEVFPNAVHEVAPIGQGTLTR